jgi:hypothetical protein
VRVLAELPGIRLERTPRMGDYARVLAAADQVLGTDGLATYRAQRGKAEADSVESDPATSTLLAFLGRTWPAEGPASWRGSMSDLLDDITPKEKPQDWPKTPRALQAKLAKFAKPLRRVGVAVSSTGEKQPGTRRTLWQIERVAAQSFNPSDPSGTAGDQGERPEGSGEGSDQPGTTLPQSFADDTGPDLRESAAKDVKDSEATPLAEPGEQTGVMCADPKCGFPLDAVWLELGDRVHPGCHDPASEEITP